MADKVVIDIEARLVDNASTNVKRVQKDLDKLDKTKVKPKIEGNTSKFERALQKAQQKADKLGRTKISTVIGAVDKASKVFGNVSSKLKSFAGKTWKATISVVDMATTPLRKVKNMLFSIQGLVTTIMAGMATRQFVMQPIGAADAYSSAKIGFSNLLGGEAQGQKMMNDLDVFAKKTPFNTSNVISNAQKMMAMGWAPEDILKDMEIIGNAAAATGKLDVGLESIVRAMSQIKTKGKLSTEELNQLAEAGISAKAMLAEQLGYGAGDAGIAAMTKDLESGAIGSQKAIDALLAGMKKYDGMMDSMANETAEGLISQLKDAFEINIIRRWGQGLQEGAKKGLGSVVELLDKSEDGLKRIGDTLFELGSEISNKAAAGLDKVIQKVLKVSESDAFKNASLSGKAKIMWNEVIGDPLGEWWESTGKAKTAEYANEIGTGLGKGISGFFKGMFGVSDDIGDGAISVGASFAEGFVEGFDAKGVAESFWEAFKNFFKEHPIAGAIFGAGVAGRVLAPFGGLGSLLGGGAKLAGKAGGAIKAAGGLKGLAESAYLYGLYGLDGLAALGGGSAAVGAGAAAGGLFGLLGIGSGVKDLIKGNKWSGGTKLAMVGAGAGVGAKAGAAIGAAFGGAGAVPGALIGAGVGGLGALFGGDKAAKKLEEGWNDLMANGKVFFNETLPTRWEEFQTSCGEVRDGISAYFNETLPGKVEDIMEYFRGRADEIREGIADVKKKFTDAADAVAAWFGEKKEKVKSAWDSLWDKLGGKKENHAAGGFVRGRQLSWLGEEGTPEVVIPLGANRRNRGLDLWQQAGRALGATAAINAYAPSQSGSTIKVDVGGVNITIKAEEGKSVIDSVREQKEEIAEEIAEIFYQVFSEKFPNVPVKA